MNLRFKRPHNKTIEAMCLTAQDRNIYQGLHPQLINAQEIIKNITGHQQVQLVNSGNSAIMIAMNSFKGPILVPDQGAWSGFLKMADFLSKEIIKVRTDRGLMRVDLLEDSIHKISPNPEALFITSFAGYTAEQPLKELFDFCTAHEILLVEDASGGVGDPEKKLSNGEHAHLILASTGTPKVVNVGSGGFVSTSKPELLEKSQLLIKSFRPSPIIGAGIAQEIRFSGNNLLKTTQAVAFLKSKMERVIHGDKRGTNLIIPCSDPQKKGQKLRQSLKVNGKSIISICPLYDRVLEKAVCVEIKNLDPDCLSREILLEMVATIEDVIF